MTVEINRRTAVLSASSTTALWLTGTRPAGSQTKSPKWPFDFSRPADNVSVYAKIVGSLTPRLTYLQYYGDIFAVVPNQVQKALFSVKGIVKSYWKPVDGEPVDDGGYEFRNFDHGLFCDYESGEVIDTYDNPFTGDTNIPLHYRSGPLTGTIKQERKDGSPFLLPWRMTGNQLSVTETVFGSRENYLSPDEWPKASTGKELYFNTSSTYIASTEDVANTDLDTVVADHIWTFLTPFPPWMLVGELPGFAMWRWIGRKIIDPQELDLSIIEEIERRQPNFFTDENPWTEHTNGWISYIKERKPKR